MNAATVRITSASTDSVQIPTLRPAMVPGLAVDVEANLWAERLMSATRLSDSDGARFLAGLLEG